jgi:purine-cytosine permease-like protein
MIHIIALYFTKEFSSEYEPFQLLLGAGIGILAVVILIKKIINKRKKQ